MAHLSVVRAVEARIAANFDACPLYVENGCAEAPADAEPFLAIQFPWCRSEWISADEFEELGSFLLTLTMPRGRGAHEARQWMDDLAALFRGSEFDEVQCFAPTSPSSDGDSETEAHFRLTVAVPYNFVIESRSPTA